jgi:LCP family protein required for cell wall assembly
MARDTQDRTRERWDDLIKSERSARGSPPRERKRHRALTYLLIFLMLIAVLVASVLAYVQVKLKSGPDLPQLETRVPTEPMNVIVLGSDARDVLPPEEVQKYDPSGHDRTTGRRADTIILLHLDEHRKQAVVLSFPRDLLVKYPNGNQGKINGAYQAGPGAVIDTVEAFTGLPVHHYVEANFVGFRKIVDALGGVDVAFERPIKEPDSGLNVPAGCVHLKGDQALAFVRVRKIDDDFGRIARQQLFMSLMMEKISSAGTIFNPVRVVKLVNLFSENVTTDADLSLRDVQQLAFRLKSFDPKKVDMRLIPSASKSIRGTSYVVANDGQTKALLAAIKERRQLPDYGRTGVSAIDPADVRVTALNGTGVAGLASKGADDLKTKGFDVAASGNADRPDYKKTTVFFKEGFPDQAALVAGPYGAAVKPMPKELQIQPPTDIAVVFGADYAEGRATPPPPPPPPKKGKAPQKPLIHRCGE